MPEYKAPPISWEWKLIATAVAIPSFVVLYTVVGAYIINKQDQRITFLEDQAKGL